MTLAKLHLGPNHGKRKLSSLELLLIAGFILFLAYMSLEPLVLPAGAAPQARPLIAAVPASAPAAAPDEAATPVPPATSASEDPQTTEAAQPAAAQQTATPAAADAIKPVFVVTPNSTVLERIAPLATVTIENLVAPAVTTDTVDAAAAPTPVAAVPQEIAAIETAPAAAAPAPAIAEAPKPAGALRFEISDATGVDGVAKNLAQSLEQSGVSIAKLVSVPAGKQRRTVILYRDGFEEEAKRLSTLFVVAPALVNNTATRDNADTADVKLVLGTAAAREKNLLASDGNLPKLSLGRLARSH